MSNRWGQQYAAYSAPQQYGQHLNERRSSFDQGDDVHLGTGQPAQQPPYQAYGQHPSAARSTGMGAQGYGGSYAAAPPPIQTNTYNPANYAAPASQAYTPTVTSPRVAMPQGNYAAAHVPYNPAAYGNTSPPTQQGNFYQPYSSPPLASYNHDQTPPLPPKPPELAQQSGSPYPRPSSDRRGAVVNQPTSVPHATHSPQSSYVGYTPPARPPPPSHNYTTSVPYESYASPAQPTSVPMPPEHRRLPSIPQDGNQSWSQGLAQNNPGWAPRKPGASLPSAGQESLDQQANRASSTRSNHSRPLPPPPEDYVSPHYGEHTNGDDVTSQQDALLAEIEAQVMGRPPTISRRPVPSSSSASRTSANGARGHSASNSLGISGGYQQEQALPIRPSDGQTGYNDDSDAEAEAGLQAMQDAELDDVSRPNRHQSTASMASTNTAVARQSSHPNEPVESDEEEYGGVDLGMLEPFHPGHAATGTGFVGGGSPLHSPPMHDHASFANHGGNNDPVSFPTGNYDWASTNDDLVSPRMLLPARVDTGGTGGLAEPSARRMSFDDGDEATLVDYDQRTSASVSPTKFDDGYPRRTGSGRPLPPTPNSDNHLTPQRYPSQENRFDPNSYEARMAAQMDVRKTNSLNGPAHTSGLTVPERSITDAEQRRRHGYRSSAYDTQAKAADAFPGPGEIDLPSIPAGRRRKFVPAKLSSKEYAQCAEPWAISSVLAWIKSMTEGESDLKEQPVIDALIGLFTHKVPTMNIADAEVLSANLVAQMIHEAALMRDEEWIKFSGLKMSGVLYQLTGTGCYSSRVHTTTMQGRCYSRLCMRTLKKIDLQAQQLAPERKTEDWLQFYKLTADDVKGHDKKEIEIQYQLHEVVTSEDLFMDGLDVLLVLFRDGLAKNDKPIIALTGKQSKFLNDVFGKAPAVMKINEDYLLPQLKYRQQEQGPWITGFSDIFREWIRRAKTAYIEYATALPNAIFQVKEQAERNVLFKQFLDQVQLQPRTKRLGLDNYLKAPITRLQRYGLLLASIYKNMKTESQEKTNLEIAIREIRDVTLECDSKVAEMTRQTDMSDLSAKLKLRPGMNTQLNLTHLGRQIIHRGDLTRRGNNNINWVESHAILFDHYMVLAKATKSKDASGSVRAEYYDVSKLPIPMDLLVLESADDGTVMKHSVKGIVPLPTTAVSKPTTPATNGADLRLTRTTTGTQTAAPPNARSLSSPTAVQAPNYGQTVVTPDNEGLMYPFRVLHLGKSESYLLYALSPQVRQEWAEKIVFAKKQHAASLFAQNAEPFKMRVLSDSSFGYSYSEYMGVTPAHIPGTPLDRALRDLERGHGPAPSAANVVCRSAVNCATAFTPPFSNNSMLAVGTDFGVFITSQDQPRGWYKAINAQHVTQISVLEDFSVLLIISDKALIAFHLDAVCPPQGKQQNNADDHKRTPQKLSGSRDVGYFAVGRMKERMLVVYKKRDGISSTFKVLEPVYHKSSTASSSGSGWGRLRSGMKKGTTEFFRDFDDFYIATDTYAINLFSSSLGIATSKGIEVLTLDKKVPISIPDLRAPEVQSIAARIKDQRPLGMFRLTDSEFLLVFQEVAIYVDKHGEISRAVVMEFVGKAKQAALHQGTYLVLVDEDGKFIEVRNATDGRLRQIVPGRDVKMLDDGMAPGASSAGAAVQSGACRGTIKISMMHPELDRMTIVLEMLLNEGISEKV